VIHPTSLFGKHSKKPDKTYNPVVLPEDIERHYCGDLLPNLPPTLAEKFRFLGAIKEKPPLPTQFDALLVIDMQKEFCKAGTIYNALFADRRGNQETEAVTKHTAPIIKEFRQSSLPIYSIYYAEAPKNPWLINFYGYKYNNKDTLIHKSTNSAFKTSSNNFAEKLEAAGHKNLLIAGFNTNACVRETINHAQKLGFNTWLMLDCTGNDNNNCSPAVTANLLELHSHGMQFTSSAIALDHVKSIQRP
jgi:nicotinamidase-related amidase